MTTFIPKLARITSGRIKEGKHSAADRKRSGAKVNVEYLSGLVPLLRRRLAISRSFSDSAMLASLMAVAKRTSHEERWQAAEASTLGQHLASSGKNMHHALVTILSLLPKPYL